MFKVYQLSAITFLAQMNWQIKHKEITEFQQTITNTKKLSKEDQDKNIKNYQLPLFAEGQPIRNLPERGLLVPAL